MRGTAIARRWPTGTTGAPTPPPGDGVSYVAKERAELRCHIHGELFVSFPKVGGALPTRGCPTCVGLIRDRVRLEIDRRHRPAGLEDRSRLFEGLR
jgi:hypothetical protein